ncbi:MAG: zf-TFIIB domain-containing protein [bacterium]
MLCPACSKLLKEIDVQGVKLDVCDDGCAGSWFDNFELKKFDEEHEPADQLINLKKKQGAQVDMNAKRKCPICKDVTMMRHFFGVKRKVTIDECPGCAGIWLDGGELAALRDEYKTEANKKELTEQFFNKEFGAQLKAMAAQSQASLQRAKRFANVFRFACPSNYMPGKQDWGAF